MDSSFRRSDDIELEPEEGFLVFAVLQGIR